MFERQRKLPKPEPEYAKYGPNFSPTDWYPMIIANSIYDEFLVKDGKWVAENYWQLLKSDFLERGYTDSEFQALADATRGELDMFRMEVELETEINHD